MSAKRWCFTINRYTEEEVETVAELFQSEDVDYGVCGKEVGESGTPHLQGYLILAKKLRINQVRTLLGGRAHCEIARGTPRQASEYCKKGGEYIEEGDCPAGNEAVAGSRKRSRDEVAKDWVTAFSGGRAAVEKFAEENPGVYAWSRHILVRNSLESAIPIDRPGVNVRWMWGPPGVGKSRRAHELLPDAYLKEPRTKWWNGYMLEKSVIIDDFAPKGIDMNHLLRWFDRYKCNVEVKGSMVPLHADTFIVTSNFSPRDCFLLDNGEEHPQMGALLRRITVEHHVNFTI